MSSRVSAHWLAALVILPFAAAQPLHASELSGSVTLTSDYVFRGISQTQGNPASQAGLRVDTANGFYGSAWVSTIDFTSAPDASAEVDYVLGWHQELGDSWLGDINVTYFTYPSTSAHLNYVEVIATATYRERIWLLLGASSDVFATGRTGLYAQTGVRVPLTDRLRLELAGGYYRLDQAYGRDYAHGQVTAAWLMHPKVEFRVTGHLTNRKAIAIFGETASSRIEAAMQASF